MDSSTESKMGAPTVAFLVAAIGISYTIASARSFIFYMHCNLARESVRFSYIVYMQIIFATDHNCYSTWSVRAYPFYGSYGILQVCYGGYWRTVCDYDWTAEKSLAINWDTAEAAVSIASV